MKDYKALIKKYKDSKLVEEPKLEIEPEIEIATEIPEKLIDKLKKKIRKIRVDLDD